ncbi:MAG TPA: zinc ribbon domain-containing protein [Candidatus Xenobia bacterium]|jgi:RNA polymerase subunit RPABC4/transcription elongation factor Spt4
MIVWGRRLQMAAALVLLLCCGLTWVRFPLLESVMGLPGWILHGGLVAAVAIIGLVTRFRMPGLQMGLALLALGLIGMDGHVIATRTEYVLDKLQLTVSDKTTFLSHLGIALPRLAPTGWKPLQFVGYGLWASAGAALAWLGGAFMEARGYAMRYPFASVLLGRPQCRACHLNVSFDMGFCPGCGKPLSGEQACGRCGGSLRPGWRFCPCCASAAGPEPAPPPG